MQSAAEERSRAAIVYNPIKISVADLRDIVEKHERLHGWAASSWHATGKDDDGLGAATEAAADAPDVIIVVGGDGTVRAAAEAVRRTGVPLALVPRGTGNLLARNLGLPLGRVERSVEIAFTGAVREIDVVSADLEREDGSRDCHTFVVMAGIGLDAQMAENTSALAKKRIGWLAYVKPITRSVIENRHFQLRYRIGDSRVRSARAHTVIVGNCGTLTANLLLLPNARVDDGLLDAVILRPRNGVGWVRIARRLSVHWMLHGFRLGRQVLESFADLDVLGFVQGDRLTVRFETPHTVQLDGDSFGPIIAARLTVDPSALAVRVP